MAIETYVECKCISCDTYHNVKLDGAALHKIGEPYGICEKCTNSGRADPYYDGD